jgi:hypothetical protein
MVIRGVIDMLAADEGNTLDFDTKHRAIYGVVDTQNKINNQAL